MRWRLCCTFLVTVGAPGASLALASGRNRRSSLLLTLRRLVVRPRASYEELKYSSSSASRFSRIVIGELRSVRRQTLAPGAPRCRRRPSRSPRTDASASTPRWWPPGSPAPTPVSRVGVVLEPAKVCRSRSCCLAPSSCLPCQDERLRLRDGSPVGGWMPVASRQLAAFEEARAEAEEALGATMTSHAKAV